MNRRVVAEGVETSEQAAFLHQPGCGPGQGYYYCRPVASTEFTALLRNSRYLPRDLALDAAQG